MSLRQIARHRAKFDPLQIRARRRKMWLNLLGPARTKAVDDLKQERRGGGAPNKCRIRPAIEISDPDAENVVIENCDRPCVVKTVRRSRLPKNRCYII